MTSEELKELIDNSGVFAQHVLSTKPDGDWCGADMVEGWITSLRSAILQLASEVPCPECNGDGEHVRKGRNAFESCIVTDCPACNGTGNKYWKVGDE